jgi:hypothetical protein
MMGEKLLLILLGACLGFLIKSYSERTLQQRNKRKQEENQKREDRAVLTKIQDTLSAFIKTIESEQSGKSSSQFYDKLYSLSFKIQDEENKLLADEVQYFVQEHRGQDPSFYKSLGEDLDKLKSKVLAVLA